MAAPYSVKLRGYALPKFPNQCIVCLSEPDSTIKIAHHTTNAFLTFFAPFMMFFGWKSTSIPICQQCKWRFRFQRWGRTLVMLGLISIFMYFFMPMFKEWNGTTKKIVVAAMIIVCLIPYFLFEYFCPRYIDTTADKNTVTYDFKDQLYAIDFKLLNAETKSSLTKEPGLNIVLTLNSWKPYVFPETKAAILLPPDVIATFIDTDNLGAGFPPDQIFLRATLHKDEMFQENPELTYTVINSLASKAGTEVTIHDFYHYYQVSQTSDTTGEMITFYTIAIPQYLIVVSMIRKSQQPDHPLLTEIESNIPVIIGTMT